MKVLEAVGVSKRFYGTQALDDVSLDLYEGEVLGLVGENGAGKSTLIKILAGAIQPDKGSLLIWGRPYCPKSPADAKQAGIAVIYQDRQLIPSLSVSVNLLLDQLPMRRVMKVLRIVDKKLLRKRTKELLETLGVEIDPDVPVSMLSVAEKQLVDIAKALSANARILIMDEPTASLEIKEVERLFHVVRRLKQQGTSIIFVSHRIEEVFKIADRVTVLRDARVVGTTKISETAPEEVITMMTGRKLGRGRIHTSTRFGEPALVLENVLCKGIKQTVNLTVRRGEILGVTGLLGSGALELVNLLGGKQKLACGTVQVLGRRVLIRSPRDAIKSGIGFVPEDRKGEGLIESLSIEDNMILPNLNKVCRWGFIRRREVRQLVDPIIKALQIRAPNSRTCVKFLSGGNQQKVVIGRWLLTNAQILALNQPTHGIDVGAKAEVYRLVEQFVRDGGSIVLASSEVPEIVQVSDNVLVFYQGRVSARIARERLDDQALLSCVMGVKNSGTTEC